MSDQLTRHSRKFVTAAAALLLTGFGGYVVISTAGEKPRTSSASARTHDVSLDRLSRPTGDAGPAFEKLGIPAIPHYVAGAPAKLGDKAETSAPVLEGLVAGTSTVAAFDAPVASASKSSVFSGASLAPRAHSSSGGGFASGGFGMSGVGAWGGASGTARPVSEPRAAAAPAAATKAVTPKAQAPRASGGSGSSGSSGSSSGSTASGGATVASGSAAVAAQFAPGGPGFTAGVVTPVGGASLAAPPVALAPIAGDGPSPSPNPEPMTMILMGAGLAGLYKARRLVV